MRLTQSWDVLGFAALRPMAKASIGLFIRTGLNWLEGFGPVRVTITLSATQAETQSQSRVPRLSSSSSTCVT